MRISTSQLHQQSLNAMQRQQAKAQQTEQQISSGLRIMRPSDDPVGAVKVLNLNSNMGTVDQYARNIAQAQSSLALEESVLTSVNDSLQRIRELTLQASNPANNASARNSIALELDEHLKSLNGMANTRDVNGEYIFSGNRVNAPPFVDAGGAIVYQGDQGQRTMLVGDSARIPTRDSGASVFMNIPNGDGSVNVAASSSNTGTVVVGQFGLSANAINDTYTLTFGQGQPMTWSVTDSVSPVPNVVASGQYTSGNNISVAGAQFSLAGNPAAGDTVTIGPAEHVDLFTTVANLSAALKSPATGSVATAKLNNALNQGLSGIDQAFNNIQNFRASVGSRLNNIDSVESINQDFKLQLETVLSATQDLDYAEAITRFNLQLTSLQAAQQAYAKTADLSLFNYI